jgi:hypothetical protein
VATATSAVLAVGVLKFYFSPPSCLPFLLHLLSLTLAESRRAGEGEDRSSHLCKMELPRKALSTPLACLLPAAHPATR